MTPLFYHSDLSVDIQVRKGTIQATAFTNPLSYYNILFNHVVNFWRWRAEGQKPWFRHNPNFDRIDPQYYYNTKDCEIVFDETSRVYSFYIRDDTFPDGLWIGKFKVHTNELEILESNELREGIRLNDVPLDIKG